MSVHIRRPCCDHRRSSTVRGNHLLHGAHGNAPFPTSAAESRAGRIRRTVTRAGTLCVVWLALLALACVVGYFLVGPSDRAHRGRSTCPWPSSLREPPSGPRRCLRRAPGRTPGHVRRVGAGAADPLAQGESARGGEPGRRRRSIGGQAAALSTAVRRSSPVHVRPGTHHDRRLRLLDPVVPTRPSGSRSWRPAARRHQVRRWPHASGAPCECDRPAVIIPASRWRSVCTGPPTWWSANSWRAGCVRHPTGFVGFPCGRRGRHRAPSHRGR